MKTKLVVTFFVSFFSLSVFSQKLGKEMALYAEKKDNNYYLVRMVKDQPVPKVYIYSAGVTKPYKSYTDIKDLLIDFPGLMQSNNSTKEELVSVLNKDGHFYEVTSQRKDPKNFEKVTVTLYEVDRGQRRIVEEYNSVYELATSPYKQAVFID
ncbi:hypothetical protein M2347_003288 [Chryseobacterium sp. H1D6B]|uniref:hypothetical protein n=1 Tax=Chryseobacterium sp. H1D6B TaxID=2940588 RepID=UPI0015CB5594|nr:hypothetical protein [Chryseobacterium sp. H1D6B]MDH6253561.1 hypothetical protein [Chryseobacterium sp. H1D6B]